MAVDSFKYLSRLVSRYYQLSRIEPELPIPWTPLAKPLADCRLALATSGGLYMAGVDPPFDLDGERRTPSWGDPDYRVIRTDEVEGGGDLRVSHLHIKAEPIEADPNVLLPIEPMRVLAAEGRIGSLAAEAYSFMGYQGFPADHSGWRERSGPAARDRMLAAGVDAVLLTTA